MKEGPEYGVLRLHLLSELKSLVELIHSLVGLDSLSVRPMSYQIKVYFPKMHNKIKLYFEKNEFYEAESDLTLDFYRLFRTIPPFEPLFYENYYNNVKIIGDYVWFIYSADIENYKHLLEQFSPFEKLCADRLNNMNIRCNEIICGEYEKRGDKLFIKSIIIPRMIADGKTQWYKFLNIKQYGKNGTSKIRLSYGYEFGRRKFREIGIETPYKMDIRKVNDLQQQLSGLKRKSGGYRINTLNYVSYARQGYELSTDPFSSGEKSIVCTSRIVFGKNILCKDFYGYGRYSYSRRIFPKVNAFIQNEINKRDLRKLKDEYEVPFTGFLIHNTTLFSVVKEFNFYLPVNRLLIRIKPDKEPSTLPKRTNGFIVLFHEDLVRAFIDTISIPSEEANYFCVTNKNLHGRVNLIDLLISKYVLHKLLYHEQDYKVKFDTSQGFISFYTSNGNIELSSYVKSNYTKIVNSNDFQEFVGKVISHTLAHLFINYISEKLDIELDDLIYVYGLIPIYDKKVQTSINIKNMFFAGVFESNDYGSINLDSELLFKVFNITFKNKKDNRIQKIDVLTLSTFLKELRENVDKVYEQELDIIQQYSKENSEVVKNIAILVSNDISQSNKTCTELVETLTNGLIEVLSSTVIKLKANKLILDQTSLSILVLRAFNNDEIKKQVIKYILSKKTSKRAELDNESTYRCAEQIIDLIMDKYHTALILNIEPNYCMDGCAADIHLERYCSSTLEEPLTTSRCALKYFLAFTGVDPDANPNHFGFKTKGETLERLLSIATKKVVIQTAFIQKGGIDALTNILRKDVKVKLYLDKRLRLSSQKYLKDLEEIKSIEQFKNKFDYEFTKLPDHGKYLLVDNMIIQTSWNYGTSKEPLQTYYSKVINK